MSKIRVLRLMEYIYDSIELAESDQARWQVQGVYRPNTSVTIKSAALPLEVLPDEPETRRASRSCCTVHLPEVIRTAVGREISVSPRRQSAFGGTLCALCLRRFVDNQVTFTVLADSFSEEASSDE
jgi:hypothetical protein